MKWFWSVIVCLVGGVFVLPGSLLLSSEAQAQGTCWDARTKDHRPCGWNPPSSTRQRQPTYVPSGPSYQELELQRQEQLRLQRKRERREKAERDRKRAFDDAKREALGLLKGSAPVSGRLKSSVGGELKLKSGTPTFGIKANPDGQLRLKDPTAVKLKNPQTASVDPAFFTRPKARLRIRGVPNPMRAPKGTWLRYVKSDRAGLILDALEAGKGDLDRSIAYLDSQIIRYDSHVKAFAALSYLEGLKTSYIAAGAAYRKRAKGPGQPTTLDSNALLQAILEVSGGDARSGNWPGPNNPNPGAKPVNQHDWRVKRTTMMLAAFEERPDDLAAAHARLRAARDFITAENAQHYLRGVYAYWDYLGKKGRI